MNHTRYSYFLLLSFCIYFSNGASFLDVISDCEIKGADCKSCVDLDPSCSWCSPIGLCLNITGTESYFGYPAAFACQQLSSGSLFRTCETVPDQYCAKKYGEYYCGDCKADPNCGYCGFRCFEKVASPSCIFAGGVWNSCVNGTLEETTTLTPSPSPIVTPPDSNDSVPVIAISLGVIIPVVVLGVLVALAVIFIIRRRRQRRNAAAEEMSDLHIGGGSNDSDMKDWEINYNEIKIGRELGRGAFGIVYQSKWRNADCCVKQLQIDSQDNVVLLDFISEAKVMRKLKNHPNLVNLIGVCTNPAYPLCIVTELLLERSLHTLLNEPEVTINALIAIQMAKDVASGMSHIHSENLLHCDLACRNLLVSSIAENRYRIKVADFGLSKTIEAETFKADEHVKFPVRWCAPEVLSSHLFSKASDVFSFGVVLWEILERKMPYPNMNNQTVIKKVCSGYRLDKPSFIPYPDELWELMQKCWTEDPKTRPSFNQIYKTLEELEKSASTNTLYNSTSKKNVIQGENQGTTEAFYSDNVPNQSGAVNYYGSSTVADSYANVNQSSDYEKSQVPNYTKLDK